MKAKYRSSWSTQTILPLVRLHLVGTPLVLTGSASCMQPAAPEFAGKTLLML